MLLYIVPSIASPILPVLVDKLYKTLGVLVCDIFSEVDAEEVGERALASEVETFGLQVGEKFLEVVFVTVSNA